MAAPRATLALERVRLLVVTFNERIKVRENSEKLAKEMTVALEGAENCNLNWKFANAFNIGSIHIKFNIEIIPECTVRASMKYVVHFLSPDLITDLSDNILATDNLKANAKNSYYTSANEQAAISALGSGFTSSSYITFGVIIGFSLFQSADTGPFWIFLNMLQLISYLPILKVFVPQTLSTFLTEYLSITGLSIPFDIIPDIGFDPLELFEYFIAYPFNEFFEIAGYESINFLFNFADELLTWFLLFLLYLLLIILNKIVPKEK